MDTGQLILLSAIAVIVLYAIIYFAVYNATNSMRKFAKIQAALICQMARRAGVTEQEIEDAYNLK